MRRLIGQTLYSETSSFVAILMVITLTLTHHTYRVMNTTTLRVTVTVTVSSHVQSKVLHHEECCAGLEGWLIHRTCTGEGSRFMTVCAWLTSAARVQEACHETVHSDVGVG